MLDEKPISYLFVFLLFFVFVSLVLFFSLHRTKTNNVCSQKFEIIRILEKIRAKKKLEIQFAAHLKRGEKTLIHRIIFIIIRIEIVNNIEPTKI